MREVEIKILNIDPKEIRKLLKQHKAKLVKKVLQGNTHYKNDYAKKHKVTVRLREEGKRGVLTVKTDKTVVNGHKVQDEYETPIDPKIAKKMLGLLGFKLRRITEMKREYYRLGGCSVEICELPRLPIYLEIEGPASSIKKVAKLLGYSEKDYVAKNAFEIYSIGKNLTFE
jgi:predicted adenylyl cyclase CyaB